MLATQLVSDFYKEEAEGKWVYEGQSCKTLLHKKQLALEHQQKCSECQEPYTMTVLAAKKLLADALKDDSVDDLHARVHAAGVDHHQIHAW